MKRKIIFVGGIHGVGKGTLCQQIRSKYEILHFSASHLLKWTEIGLPANKKVVDFDLTQKRLLKGIDENIPKGELAILDGHFTLLNNEGLPEVINEETFYKINPLAIVIILENIDIISKRLADRDSAIYNINTLSKMQEMELDQAKKISSILDIPLCEINGGDISKFGELIIALK